MNRSAVFVSLFVWIASAVFAGGIPPEVAEKIDGAEMLSDAEAFVGSFTMTTTTVVQKPNGKARKDIEVVMRSTRHADGTVEHRLERMIEDGDDVTEERRDKTEKSFAKNGNGADDDSENDDEDFVDPYGETADRFVFGTVKRDGLIATVTFEPRPEHQKSKGMTTGAAAWDSQTLDPLWIKFKAVNAPGPLKELDLELEFARLGDTVFIERVFTTGLAKIVLIKRQFESDIRISNIERR